jgi:pyruvate/2-oxoglutarate dehydrogenase complex dihydrolipoamide acyltransferase (E2) component
MAAGDYWSAYRKDHARWRAENPNADTYGYPGNPALGIRSDAQQLQAMSGGRNLSEAQINQIRADEHRMQQGQLGNIPEYVNPNEETTAAGIVPLNNWINGVQTQASIDRGNRAVDAAGGSLDITDYGPLFQAEADRLMANLTEEELRDGLFLEPQLKIVDGKVVGKMGIPDIFTQDKGFGRIDLFADDGWSEFDPENPYAEPSKDLVLGSDNNYYNEYDDLMLEPVIPATQDASEYAAEQEALRVAQAQADAKAAQEAQEKYIREQMEARDAVLAEQQRQEQIRQNEESARQLLAAQAAAQAKAKAEAEAKAAAAAASAAAAAQAAAQAQEYETGPVDTPNIFTSTPEPSSFSNYNDDYSNYTNSYFSGGFW